MTRNFEQAAWFITLTIEAFLLINWWARNRIVSVTPLVMAYVVILQAAYLAASAGVLDKALGELSAQSYYYVLSKVQAIYLAIFAVTYSAGLTVTGSPKKSVADEVRLLAAKASGGRALMVLVIASCVIVILNIAFLKLDIVWRNSEYLLMTSPNAYNAPPRVAMVLKVLLNLVGLALSIAVPILLASRRHLIALISAIPWLGSFAFQFGAHSRFAGVMLAILLTVALVVGEKKFRGAIAVVGVIVVPACVMFAIVGRGQSLHGIGTIPSSVAQVWQESDAQLFSYTITNLLQGVFVTGDALLSQVNHPTAYKILSFSPLPAAIDNFDHWLSCCEVRVNEYVPMSAVAEVVQFGALFWAGSLLFVFLLFRICHKLTVTRGGLAALSLNLLAFLFFVVANAYPVRNVVRQLLGVLVITCLFSVIRGRRVVFASKVSLSRKRQ